MRNFVAPPNIFLMVDIKNRFSTFERYIKNFLEKVCAHKRHTKNKVCAHKRHKNSHVAEKIFWVQKFLQKNFFKDILMNFIYIPKIVSEAIFDIYRQKKSQGGG